MNKIINNILTYDYALMKFNLNITCDMQGISCRYNVIEPCIVQYFEFFRVKFKTLIKLYCYEKKYQLFLFT